MNRKNLFELVAAITATAALFGCASAPAPRYAAAAPQDAARELGTARNVWAQCIRAAIPRLDDSQSSSGVLPSDAVARAAMKACSGEYTDMARALARTLAPACGRDPDCKRGALARAQREAVQTATQDVVTARVRTAGTAALQCQ